MRVATKTQGFWKFANSVALTGTGSQAFAFSIEAVKCIGLTILIVVPSILIGVGAVINYKPNAAAQNFAISVSILAYLAFLMVYANSAFRGRPVPFSVPTILVLAPIVVYVGSLTTSYFADYWFMLFVVAFFSVLRIRYLKRHTFKKEIKGVIQG